MPNGTRLMFDAEEVIRQLHAGLARNDGNQVSIAFECASPGEVDGVRAPGRRGLSKARGAVWTRIGASGTRCSATPTACGSTCTRGSPDRARSLERPRSSSSPPRPSTAARARSRSGRCPRGIQVITSTASRPARTAGSSPSRRAVGSLVQIEMLRRRSSSWSTSGPPLSASPEAARRARIADVLSGGNGNGRGRIEKSFRGDGRCRARTCDPLLSQVLSQLRISPVPRRDSNPRYGLERAVTLAFDGAARTRILARGVEEGKCLSTALGVWSSQVPILCTPELPGRAHSDGSRRD